MVGWWLVGGWLVVGLCLVGGWLVVVIYPKSYRKRPEHFAPVIELDFENEVHIPKAVLRVAYQGFRTLQLGARTLDSSLAIVEHWLTYCT